MGRVRLAARRCRTPRRMTDHHPVQQHGLAVQVWPGVILLQGQALRDAYFLVSAGIRAAARNGYPTARFEGIRRAIRDAEARAYATRHVASAVVEPHSAHEEEVTTAAAAALTGLSRRQIQRLAKSGLGRRVGRNWLLPVDLLLANIASRKGNDGARHLTITPQRGGRPTRRPNPNPRVAVQFAVESYVAALSDAELADLLARTRPGGGR